MSSLGRDSHADSTAHGTISRRKLLAVSGVVAVGGLSGCLSRVASSVTNTGASPAAPFVGIGAYTGPSPTREPTVYRLTPTVSAESGPLSGEVELEAWVTAVTLENYNTPRSNRSAANPDDLDSDDDGVNDGAEALYEYLAGEPIISEQFTITVPDASLPGNNAALVEEITPRRLIEYVTGRAHTEGNVYSWGNNKVETQYRDDKSSPYMYKALDERQTEGGETGDGTARPKRRRTRE